MHSLRHKLVLLYSATALAGILVTGLLSYAGALQEIQSGVVSRAANVADEIAYSVEILTAQAEPFPLQRLVEKAATLNDITTVAVVDRAGRIQAHNDRQQVGRPAALPQLAEALRTGTDQSSLTSTTLIFVRPLHGQAYTPESLDVVGALWIAIDMRPALARSQLLFGAVSAVSAALLGLSVGVIYLATHALIIRRLQQVAAGLRRASAGDLETPITLAAAFGAGDELNALADQFNQMLAALRTGRHELQTEHDFAQLVMTTIGQGLVVLDGAGRLEYLNPALAGLLKHAPAKLLGRPLTALTHPDDAASLRAAENRAEAGETVAQEARLIAADETVVHALVTLSPRRQRGAVAGAVAVITDLTERARLEQMKSDFINRAAHELRTPLATTILMTELLHEGGTPEENAEYWETLRGEQRRQRVLIDKLLTVGRIESGLFELRPQRTDVAGPLTEALRSIDHQAKTKGVRVSLALAEPRPLIFGDVDRLQQVFVNLLTNALKFTPAEGQVTVTVTAEPAEVCVTVQDTGIGIPPADQPHLFERFFRASNAIENEVQGTGVGLYIVKTIVEQTGGRLTLDSELGRGTTLRVWLPAAAAEEGAFAYAQ